MKYRTRRSTRLEGCSTTMKLVGDDAGNVLDLLARATKPASIVWNRSRRSRRSRAGLLTEDPVGDAVERPRDAVKSRDRYGTVERNATTRVTEALGHALGHVEEVDGVARRWGVDDDQVEASDAWSSCRRSMAM